MNTKILTTLLLSLAISGCQKQPEEVAASTANKTNPVANIQFENSDEKITKFLDQLENPNTPQNTRIQILCKDYPTEYKENYMPALMKLSPDDSRIKLLSDLNYILDYYKSNFNIKC